ncbi:MAG: hypothetical protein IKF36_04665 [Bacilli bacterium]|nr:hypothetical protein [Bacilli bacterium]
MKDRFLYYYDDLDELVESLLEQGQDEKDIYLTARNESIQEEKNKKTNISLVALEKLEEIGFQKDIGTLLFAGLIEDLYHERKVFNSSEYFDLSKPDNPHYKYLVDKFKIGDEKRYKALIALSIGTSNCDTKNINEIAYSITDKISKELSDGFILQKKA